MSENHSLLRVRKTDYICDACGEGTMIYTGSWGITTTPPGMKMYYHRCDVCGVQVAFPTTYPRTEYIQEVNQ